MAGRDPLEESELAGVFEALYRLRPKDGAMWRALFALGVGTGARISELLYLTRGQVIDSQGQIVRHLTFLKTKNGESRAVAVNPMVVPPLTAWLNEQAERGLQRKDTPLFVTSTGRRLGRTHASKILSAALRAVCPDKRLGSHSMRKTYGKAIYLHYLARQRAGENIEPLLKTMEAMGHKSVEATRRYLAFMLGNTDDAVMALYPTLREKAGKG